MNVLLIGGGGREHALAWKLKQSPLLGRLYCAPGNAGIEQVAECVALDPADHAAVIRFCKDNAIGLVAIGPEAPLVAGLADDLEASGFKVFGPSRAAARTRRLERLHQGSRRRIRHPHRRLSPLRRLLRSQGLCGRAEAADRSQGRWACRRQRRGHRRNACGGRDRHRCLFLGRVRICRRRSGDRGISRGRRGELLRPHRRQDRAAARHGARPQARLRRRPGPQHRRHGRLFAGADYDAGPLRARDGGDRCADGATPCASAARRSKACSMPG